MDQLVHDFNTALDETAGSNSSSRSSASRRKVTPNPDSYHQSSLDISNVSCNSPGSGGARVRVISTLAITSVMTAAPVWTTLAFSPGTGARAVCNSGEDTQGAQTRLTDLFSISDSDLEASGSMGTMVRQGRSRTKRGRGDIIMGIESDSFTENVQPWQDFRVHTRRRRKFKRMAIGTIL